LDPALIRPGRADVKLWFGNATADQARRLFERFFPEHIDLARDFAGRALDRHWSMATLQDYLMLHRGNPEAALRRMHEIARLQTAGPLVAAPRHKEHQEAEEEVCCS
jgi:ATP-dependent 26S proteasome regulatory subunit